MPACHGTQLVGGRGIDRELDPAALVRLLGGARAVGGELQHGGGTGENTLPVGLLAGQTTAGDGVVLDLRVVGVLHGERRQRVGPTGCPGRVEPAEFTHHDAHRVSVVHGVMERQHEYLAPCPQSDQVAAPQRAGGQVEGGACLLRPERFEARVGISTVRQIDESQGESGAGRVDVLPHLPVVLHEACPEHLMTFRQQVETAGQGVAVERPVEPEGERLVVRGVPTGELGQEPEALLGERGRPDRRRGTGIASPDRLRSRRRGGTDMA